MAREEGWIGVDLDGTLAEYDHWRGATHIGEPVQEMYRRVCGWLGEGKDVRIFTARVSHDGTRRRAEEVEDFRRALHVWMHQHFGQQLPVTNVKDHRMLELYDDRAVQVEKNTGRIIGHSTRDNT